MGHPQLTPLFGVIDQPDAAGMAVALLDEPLHELSEEPLDVGFADQQLESQLHGTVLNLDEALRATPFVGLAHERGTQHFGIARSYFLNLPEIVTA
jgi:hypothetical protein